MSSSTLYEQYYTAVLVQTIRQGTPHKDHAHAILTADRRARASLSQFEILDTLMAAQMGGETTDARPYGKRKDWTTLLRRLVEDKDGGAVLRNKVLDPDLTFLYDVRASLQVSPEFRTAIPSNACAVAAPPSTIPERLRILMTKTRTAWEHAVELYGSSEDVVFLCHMFYLASVFVSEFLRIRPFQDANTDTARAVLVAMLNSYVFGPPLATLWFPKEVLDAAVDDLGTKPINDRRFEYIYPRVEMAHYLMEIYACTATRVSWMALEA